MSHFFVGVILPKSVTSKTSRAIIEGTLKELTSPYNENTEVEEHDTECGCVGEKARIAARRAADKACGTVDELRKRFAIAKPDGSNQDWEAWIAPHIKTDKEFLAKCEYKDKPDPKCEECHGSGKRKTTYNPKSKWDWWVIGGRWNGEITGKNRDDGKGGFNFGEEFHNLKENMCKVSKIGATGFCAIITPDGEWHEEGEMGWWGMMHDKKEPEAWEKIVGQTFRAYKNHYIVGCDMHI